jgi:hypothetical protein
MGSSISAAARISNWRFPGLCAEIRDYYTGAPVYNAPPIRGGQYNVVADGGIVLKFQ